MHVHDHSTPEAGGTAKGITLGVRVPVHVFGELRRIATRDSNGISATVRRLLSRALEAEGGSDGR